MQHDSPGVSLAQLVVETGERATLYYIRTLHDSCTAYPPCGENAWRTMTHCAM